MNAGIDKVEFNYIQYVLLDINLAFILVLLYVLYSWNFILKFHKINVCPGYTLFFRSNGIHENLILEENWYIILYDLLFYVVVNLYLCLTEYCVRMAR